MSQLRPKSVLDRFMGSGTTAEVCTKLGIPWFRYEMNKNFKQDIETRLKNCVKEPQQINLLKYMEISTY
ncbi:MAG: DNA methyltransferase [Candidatus Odinarchaeota archaeon]